VERDRELSQLNRKLQALANDAFRTSESGESRLFPTDIGTPCRTEDGGNGIAEVDSVVAVRVVVEGVDVLGIEEDGGLILVMDSIRETLEKGEEGVINATGCPWISLDMAL
jgi:hypothetical protein